MKSNRFPNRFAVVPSVLRSFQSSPSVSPSVSSFSFFSPWFLSGIGTHHFSELFGHTVRRISSASSRRALPRSARIRVFVPRRARSAARRAPPPGGSRGPPRRHRWAPAPGLVHDRAVQALHRKRQRSPRRGVVVVASFFLLGAFPAPASSARRARTRRSCPPPRRASGGASSPGPSRR